MTLFEKTQTGTDGLGAPVYEETPVTVDNVLVTPVSGADAATATAPDAKRAEYELCIPKGDGHVWEDRRVAFFGRTFRTAGFAEEYIEQNVPLDWNRKIKAVRIG